jgi:hypothetical protein
VRSVTSGPAVRARAQSRRAILGCCAVPPFIHQRRASIHSVERRGPDSAPSTQKTRLGMRGDAAATIESVDWGRIVAILSRLVGDFDLAEECAQQAFSHRAVAAVPALKSRSHLVRRQMVCCEATRRVRFDRTAEPQYDHCAAMSRPIHLRSDRDRARRLALRFLSSLVGFVLLPALAVAAAAQTFTVGTTDSTRYLNTVKALTTPAMEGRRARHICLSSATKAWASSPPARRDIFSRSA